MVTIFPVGIAIQSVQHVIISYTQYIAEYLNENLLFW